MNQNMEDVMEYWTFWDNQELMLKMEVDTCEDYDLNKSEKGVKSSGNRKRNKRLIGRMRTKEYKVRQCDRIRKATQSLEEMRLWHYFKAELRGPERELDKIHPDYHFVRIVRAKSYVPSNGSMRTFKKLATKSVRNHNDFPTHEKGYFRKVYRDNPRDLGRKGIRYGN